MICSGCAHAPVYDNQGNKVDNQKCLFCRTPHPASDEEINERQNIRVEANDPFAIYETGNWFRDGKYGLPQDYSKALELWHRAGELGYAKAYCSIGVAYYKGRGVERDKKKVWYYWESGAMRGDVVARRNLGIFEEEQKGNMSRAIKHYMIAVRGGDSDSLKSIQQLYSIGHVTKDDYAKALQSYQAYLGEIKSDQRDKAAAFDAHNRYY